MFVALFLMSLLPLSTDDAVEGSALSPVREASAVIHTLRGRSAGEQFGYEASAAGDVDGDGVIDIVVGAPFAGASAGRVDVHSGRSGELLWSRSGEAGEQLGWSVAGAGDVDADGQHDVVIGAPQLAAGAGRAYVLSGADGSVLHRWDGEVVGDRFGDEVETAGDIDGDGHSDLIVGVSRTDAPGQDAGSVRIFSGATGAQLLQLDGPGPGARFGSAVHGDAGRLVVGAPGAGATGTGRVFVHDAASGELLHTFDNDAQGVALGSHFVAITPDADGDGVADIWGTDWQHAAQGPSTGRAWLWSGADGEVIQTLSGATAGDGYGIGDALAGDVDGDGLADLIVGAWTHSGAAPGGGRVELVSGRSGARLRSWTGWHAGENLGYDATGLGDVDADGHLDFLVSAAAAPLEGVNTGVVYVLSGAPAEPRANTPPAPTVARAQQLLNSGQPKQAVALLERLLARAPGHPGANMLLGGHLHATGEYARALPHHLRAAGAGGSAQLSSTALYNAACALALLGRSDEALTTLESAVGAGFANLGLLATDSDLASLRDEPRFVALLPPPPGSGSAFAEADAVILHEWRGEAPGDAFGWIARRAGDLDGDGVIDALVTANKFSGPGPLAGRIYAYSSKSGELLWTVTGRPGDQLGAAEAAGDLNGDGVPDVMLGAPAFANPSFPGRVLLCSGRDGALLLELTGEQPGSQFGGQMYGGQDLNGDGVLDVVIGAPGHAAGAGRVTIHSSDDGRVLAELNGQPGWSFGNSIALDASSGTLRLGIGASGAAGTGRMHVYEGWPPQPVRVHEPDAASNAYGMYFASYAGDVDGDGVSDLLSVDFQSAAAGPSSGRAWVHSGDDGTLLHTFTGAPGDGLGIGVSRVGDVDGDGHADLLIGSWLCSDAATQGGRVTLFSGADGSVLQQFTDTAAFDQFGYDTDGLGDVDGDGVTDFLVTAANSNLNGAASGRAFILKGAPKRAR